MLECFHPIDEIGWMVPPEEISMRVRLNSLLTCLLAASVLAACSPASQSGDSANPVNTGSLESEGQFGALNLSSARRGQQVYVASEELRMRTSPEVREDNIADSAHMNDKLEIVDPSPVGKNKFIQVRVLESSDSGLIGKTLYTSADYLDSKPVQRRSSSTAATTSRYFVITNVATEIVRLYERCQAPETCQNKMVMEFKATVGNNSKEMRSDVGTYKVTGWTKFYQSGPYAGYYRPGYPELPKVGQRDAWLGKARPEGFKGPRGAFGWYTAMVGPNPSGQWMHGTIGWGADKDKYVRFQDSFLGGIIDMFAALGSHGCTRMSNEAIAFMREKLPVGATYIKIYAREALADQARTGYPTKDQKGRFDYILTNLAPGQTNTRHDLPGRDSVLAAGTPQANWMEEGTFSYDQTPDPAKDSDHYNLGANVFRGVFYVDQGTVSSDYQHPVHKKLHIGGASGGLPDFVKARSVLP